MLAGIASFTPVYFLQRVAPRGWEDGNQWLFAIPPLLAAIITGVIVGWVIDRTARTTAAFGAAFVTAPFISMCLMLLLRAILGVNKEAPGLPLIIASAGDARYHLWRNWADRGDSFRALSELPVRFRIHVCDRRHGRKYPLAIA